MRRLFMLLIVVIALLSVNSAAFGQDRQVVNVYSARTYSAMEGAFVRFTEETGIEVRLSQGSTQDLLGRLRAEGAQSVADVFFPIDAGALVIAANEGLLQPIESEILTNAVPEHLRDPQNRWFAVSQRVRTIMYNPATVDASQLSTYEQLADPMWNGRLCLRPATHIYTISLVASLIAAHGEEEAERIVAGWVANQPQYIDSDTRILETIAEGGCDVGITNHYYLARKLSEDASFPVAIFFANQPADGVVATLEADATAEAVDPAVRGAHRNISGVGVTASAVNYDNAVRLLEWLVTDGQAADANGIPGGNYEFPVNPEADLHPIPAAWGEFVIDPLPLEQYGTYQEAAIELLDRTGYGF